MLFIRKYLYLIFTVEFNMSIFPEKGERMSCSVCTTGFSLFRREHACPGCGFSVCSGCLKQTMTVKNKQQKVCNKCFSQAKNPRDQHVPEPPEALQKRMERQPLPRGLTQPRPPAALSSEDQKIAARLKSLQAERGTSTPSADQVRERLDKLRDLPSGSSRPNPPVYQRPDTRSSTEKTKDLFGAVQAEVDLEARLPILTPEQEIERRLARLKGENPESLPSRQQPNLPDPARYLMSSEDPLLDMEDDSVDDVNKLIQEVDKKMKLEAENALKDLEKDKAIQEQLARLKVKRTEGVEPDPEDSDEDISDNLLSKILAESRLEDRLSPLPPDAGEGRAGGEPEELPWCVICNEDAVTRASDGDLYCQECFKELHREEYDRKRRFKSMK